MSLLSRPQLVYAFQEKGFNQLRIIINLFFTIPQFKVVTQNGNNVENLDKIIDNISIEIENLENINKKDKKNKTVNKNNKNKDNDNSQKKPELTDYSFLNFKVLSDIISLNLAKMNLKLEENIANVYFI